MVRTYDYEHKNKQLRNASVPDEQIAHFVTPNIDGLTPTTALTGFCPSLRTAELSPTASEHH